jgi:hypothetical protein
MVWRGATMLFMMALWARWCFASHPTRRGLRHGLRHRFLISRGRRTGVGSRPQVANCLAAYGAWCPWSRPLGSWLLLAWMSYKLRPSSWIPSRSGWSHTWKVDHRTGHHHLMVLSCLCCVAQGWRLTELRWPLSPRSLRGQCSVPLRQRKGVMADPDLSVWPGPLSLARPRSFGLILAGVLWAARAAI